MIIMIRRTAKVAIILLVLAICCCANKSIRISLPNGWTAPAKSLTEDEWRNRDSNRYLAVEGDFNGDGIVDVARFLVREDGAEMGLFVFLSEKKKQYNTFVLDRKPNATSLRSLGIEVVHPGRFETACSKGFAECHESDPHELVIYNDAINYFKYESATMYFYWDESVHSFKGVGIDD